MRNTLIREVLQDIRGKEPEFTADDDCMTVTMCRDETTIAHVNTPEGETVYKTIYETIKLAAIQ